MTRTIDTLGKAARHGMLLRVQCSRCNGDRYYRTTSLLDVYSAGRDPLRLPFRCHGCEPPPQRLSLLEPRFLDPATDVLRLNGKGNKRQWVAERLGPVKTLRDSWMQYETILISCQTYGCGHHQAVDFARTAAKLGWDHPAMSENLLPYFFCSKCRDQGMTAKELSLSLHVDTRPATEGKTGIPEMWKRYPQSELPPA
jgi:hypothetical protein